MYIFASAYTSNASALMPGNEPPTSSTCAVTAANPSSSPSWKIGTATATSGECDAPRYGWLWTITSPSSISPSSR